MLQEAPRRDHEGEGPVYRLQEDKVSWNDRDRHSIRGVVSLRELSAIWNNSVRLGPGAGGHLMVLTDRLSVLFLESSRNFGGQERRLLNEARWLSERGHNIAIAVPVDGIAFQRAASTGLKTFRVPMRRSFELSSLYRLIKIIRDHQIDILYSHSGKDSWLGGICSFLTAVPLIRSRELLTPIKHKTPYNLLPKRILACSEAVKKHLLANGVDGERIFVHYPPVETRKFSGVSYSEIQTLRRELCVNDHFPIIVCVGEFRQEKRQIDLLLALKSLSQKYPSVRLVLVGSGKGSAMLRASAVDLGVCDSVLFLGEREDIPAILAIADVFVLVSSSEPFGMSAVEAMAAGLPVVVTRVGGLVEIVSDGIDGIHVPPMSPEAISEAISRIVRDPGLREGLITKGMIRAKYFDAPIAMDRLFGHFQEVIRAQGRHSDVANA